MEIHPERKPVLLVAGVDDMNMCELSLDETGLTSKKGAEILEKDFEQEWNKYNGREYLKSHRTQISSKYVSQLLGKIH
jgi:myosin-6